MGVPIVSPERLTEENPAQAVIMITTDSWVENIYDQILSLGDFAVFSYNRAYKQFDFICLLFDRAHELSEVMNMLHDDQSKYVYAKALKKYQIGEPDFSDLYTPNQYFLAERYEQYAGRDEIIIDGGAYDGDSLIRFAEFFGPCLKRIYSFEPVPANRDELQKAAARYKKYDIRIMPYALDEVDAEQIFSLPFRIMSSHLQGRSAHYSKTPHRIKEEITVEARALDHIIPHEEKVAFIKMDIEGGEFAALKGARRIMEKHKPSLAIALYHNPEDYIRIPQLIKAIVPEYKLFIRHHNKKFQDTILYAFI
jgi:FkbM family methyltransferase